MLDLMKKTITRNLLKYSAGTHITCPHCDAIADYRRWVIAESPTGANMWQGCSNCFEHVRSQAEERGWTVTRESAPKAAKSPRGAYPQKAGRVLDTFLRKDILKGHKITSNLAKADRFFPAGVPDWHIIETTQDNGTVDIGFNWESKDISSRALTDAYVRAYCESNHLTQGMS
jgi:hypothetical protein